MKKLRHTAVLALVDWYLIIPPVSQNGREILFTAPMGKWANLGAFDSATDCRSAKAALARRADKDYQQEGKEFQAFEAQENAQIARQESPASTGRKLVEALRQEFLLKYGPPQAQCIASDDPRLKGN